MAISLWKRLAHWHEGGQRLNPFKHLVESKHFPQARALRSGFRKKVRDTFRVFAGYVEPSGFPEEGGWGRNSIQSMSFSAGLFDYFTILPIFPYINVLMNWSWETLREFQYSLEKPPVMKDRIGPDIPERPPLGTLILASIVVVPITLINMTIHAVRFITAGVLTFLSLPLIGIVHGITSLFSKKHKETILEFEDNTHHKIKDKMNINDVEDIKEIDYTLPTNKKLTVHLSFWKKGAAFSNDNGMDNTPDPNKKILYGESIEKVYEMDLDVNNEKEKNVLLSLFTLNAGELARTWEFDRWSTKYRSFNGEPKEEPKEHEIEDKLFPTNKLK